MNYEKCGEIEKMKRKKDPVAVTNIKTATIFVGTTTTKSNDDNNTKRNATFSNFRSIEKLITLFPFWSFDYIFVYSICSMLFNE